MSDPHQLVAAIDAARDAFEYAGTGSPHFERHVAQGEEWKTQLTKACRYLASARALREQDGFNGAVVELCFSAIERTLEAYLLRYTADDLTDYRDHETVYTVQLSRAFSSERQRESYSVSIDGIGPNTTTEGSCRPSKRRTRCSNSRVTSTAT